MKKIKRTSKKLMSVLLSILMIMSVPGMVSFGAYRGVEFEDYGNGTYGGSWVHTYNEEETGKGEGTWFLDKDGVLTVSGWGEFDGYNLLCNFPCLTLENECNYCMEVVHEWSFDEETGTEELKTELRKTRHFYSYLNKIKKIVFSEGITRINDFGSPEGSLCSVEEIVLPESLLNIDDIICGNASMNLPKNCFMGGAEESINGINVKEIKVDENSVYYSTDKDGNIYNKDKTVLYKYMSSAPIFTVPDTVKEIAQYAFAYNDVIKSVTVPWSVKTIGNEAFMCCCNLENIFLERGLEGIGERAFALCISLEEISIPSTVSALGALSFMHCWSLKEITVPSNDTDLSVSALGILSFENDETALALSKEYVFAGLTVEMSKATEHDEEKHINAVTQAQCSVNQIAQKLFEKGIDPLSGEKVYISDILTIYCNEGSTAEAYAIENGIKYVSEVCEHSFGEWVADEENGIRYKTCSKCGKTYEEELEADDDTIDIEGNEGDNKFTVELIENPESTEYIYVRGLLEGNIIALYDINLLDENGNKVQPEGMVKVRLPLDEEVTYFTVLRVNGDGTYTDMKAVREGNSVVFETDHFSYYVILGGENAEDTGNNIKCECLCHKTPLLEIIMRIFKMLAKFLGTEITFPCDC